MTNPFILPGQTGNVAPIGKQRKQADAFINLALPRAEGGNSKIGDGIRLYFDDAGQKQLAELMQTEEGIKRFRDAVIITCNYNVPAEKKSGFVL